MNNSSQYFDNNPIIIFSTSFSKQFNKLITLYNLTKLKSHLPLFSNKIHQAFFYLLSWYLNLITCWIIAISLLLFHFQIMHILQKLILSGLEAFDIDYDIRVWKITSFVAFWWATLGRTDGSTYELFGGGGKTDSQTNFSFIFMEVVIRPAISLNAGIVLVYWGLVYQNAI